MSRWLRGLSVLGALLVVAACSGTETDNPIVSGEPPAYESPTGFNQEESGRPPCPPPLDLGKPRRLPLWGHDGSLIVGADRYSGLRVIDVSDPEQPEVTAQLALAGEPRTLLVQSGAAVTLAIDEVPELHQASVPDPASLEPVTRLVRYDASDPSAPVRVADVAIEGELWRVLQRGELTWVMSANVLHPQPSCDRQPVYDCGYVTRSGLILTAYRFVDNAWDVAQRVELRMDGQGWATPEGFASFEATGDAEANSTGGIVRAVRFEADGRLGAAIELRVPRQVAWGAPISLAGDQARVLLRDLGDGSVQLAIFELASGEMLSLLRGIGTQAGPSTRFGAHAVYLGDEGSQQGAVFIDTSDGSAPVASAFPAPISRAVPLDDEGTRLLGVSAGAAGTGLAFSLLQQQDRALTLLANELVPDAVAMPDSEALWRDGEHVFYVYQRQNGSFALGMLDAGMSSLTPTAIVAEGYPDELVAMADAVYAPDAFGLQVVPLDDGVAGPRIDWNSEVSAYVVAGEYEAALVQRPSEPIALELSRDGDTQRFAVGPGARRLIADGEHVLVLSSEPADQCEQTGRDCSDYAPNVAVFALGDAPHLVAEVPLPDADSNVNDSAASARLDWESGEQGLALGDGRYLFVADFEASCTSEAGCQALGISARPIGESNVNVASPGAPAPCPPNAASCEQPAAPPPPTAYGDQRSQRFYVLDASGSEPRFGAGAESVLERGASRFGPPRVSEGRVLATRIERDVARVTPGVSTVPSDVAAFMLDRFELAADGSLRALPALNVPGYPLALRADGTLLISVEPDAQHQGAASLYRLELRDDGAYAQQTLALDPSYGEVEVANGLAFYLRRDGEGCSGTTELVLISLPDDERGELRALPSLQLAGADWTVADVRAGQVLLSSGQRRFAVIDVSGEVPQLRTFISAAGYLQEPQLNGDTIIGAGALWGKQRLAL